MWGDGFEQTISRILYLRGLATTPVAIIYLGRSFAQAPLEAERPEKRVHTVNAAVPRLV